MKNSYNTYYDIIYTPNTSLEDDVVYIIKNIINPDSVEYIKLSEEDYGVKVTTFIYNQKDDDQGKRNHHR